MTVEWEQLTLPFDEGEEEPESEVTQLIQK
jgi:hypothetical protein